ncbi:MAG TPA: MATE family efflux transporter [Anaeromyxobacteraceae bacterium]|nr:MATE family efflux transporter [Anaeromyxobacteraceae bacterium]
MSRRHPIREELASLARLAAPLSAATAGQALMGLVDTAVTGRAGAEALAGTGLGNALYFAVAVFGMGLMMGLEPLTAQALGAGDRRGARRWLWQGAWMALGVGALLVAVLAPIPLALVPLGIGPEVARQASGFLWARLPGLPAFLFFFGARAYLQSLGRVRVLVLAVAAANLGNLALDLLLVFGGAGLPAWTGPLRAVPAMGAAGAGLSTTVVTFLQVAILAWAASRERVGALAPGERRPRADDLRLAARVGLPVGLHMGAEVGIFALVGFLAGRLGPAEMGAHQIAIALASLTFTVAVGVGQAASVRVGWAVGRGDTAAARRAGFVAFAAGAGFMALCGVTFLAAPGALARLMSDDPRVVAAAAPLLVVAAVFQVSDGTQAVGAGALRGAGDTRFTFAANMVGHWLVGFPLAIALGLLAGGGVTGLWWGLCAGLSAVGAALLARFVRVSSRPIAPLASREATTA